MARILIIDDEPNLRSMLRRMLHLAGHQVSEAGNGAEGINLYERDRPSHDNNLYGPGGAISNRARYIIPAALAC